MVFDGGGDDFELQSSDNAVLVLSSNDFGSR